MDSDVAIKLIYAASLTTIFAILMCRTPTDVGVISLLVGSFTTALSSIFTYNLTKKNYEKIIEELNERSRSGKNKHL